MSLSARIEALAQRVAAEFNDVRGVLPDTTSAPIATTDDAVSITQGLQGALVDSLKAAAGDVGKTTFFVQAADPAGGECLIACLEDGLLFINDEFIQSMVAQETYQFLAQVGDKLEMRGGGMNAVNRVDLQYTPIEVNNTANAGVEFFWNRFRETNGDEFTTATLPVTTNIKVYGPNPTFVAGAVTGVPQHDIDIPGGQTVAYVTNGVGEYYMIASQPVIHSSTNTHSSGAADPRAVNPPVVGKSIGHTRSGGGNNLSSLRANNNVTAYQRSGESAVFIASPGSPSKLDVGIGGNTDFDPNDIAILVAEGETCAYAGADSGGRNATQFQSVRSASNNFVTTLDIQVSGLDSRGVLFGEFECEWLVFDPDGSLRGGINMRRGNSGSTASPATTAAHQLHPAAVNFGPNEGIFAGLSTIPRGTRFISNMPAFMIANYYHTVDLIAFEDETTVFGTVLPSYLCETRTRQNGLLERLVLDDATGVSTWEPA